MHGVEGFLGDLAVVLSVAALTTVLFQRVRQPVVLGYLLAGLLIGPHVLGLGQLATLHTLSELGVVLLMFSLGLEFSVRKLMGLGPRSCVLGATEVGLMGCLGFLAGRGFGFGTTESVFLGAMLSISSTMIVAKTFAEERPDRAVRELVFGVLVVEDVVAILLLATLSAVARGAQLSTSGVVWDFFKLACLLVLFVSAGLLIVPRFLSFVLRSRNPETSLVATVGTCFAGALLAREFGYSAGLGAFLAGSLAAESGQARSLELLVRPLRDLFAAIFFVTVGMLIDPDVIWEHAGTVLALVGLVVGGKIVGVTVGALLTGHGTQPALRAGLSLTQIGEFSFLIAGVALPLGETAHFLYPVAVAVCVITSFTTPLLVRRSAGIASFLERLLPERVRTFVALYGSWLEGLRRPKEEPVLAKTLLRRTVRLLFLDVGILIALVVAVSLSLTELLDLLEEGSGLPRATVEIAVQSTAVLVGVPFAIGIFRCVRLLGLLIATEAMPHGTDLEHSAPQRALVLGLQLAIFLAVGLPILALTQPFLPLLPGLLVLGSGLLGASVFFWRTTTRLQGHVRAGSVMVAEVLSRQGRATQPLALDHVEELLPGLGKLLPVHVDPGDAASGRTLGELDLRGRTGATVVCISRGHDEMLVPGSSDPLRLGDVLVLSGSSDALRAARSLLKTGEAPAVAALA